MSDVWVCMRDVISEFNSEIEGSPAFYALMLFLCSILCLMCSGSSLQVYLDIWDVVFVCMENDVCKNGVCRVYIWWWLNDRETTSVPVVNCVQFALI